MANPAHVDILKSNVQVWNDWRKKNRDRRVDLREANLDGLNLSNANLSGVLLARASLKKTKLIKANLRGTKLTAANLAGSDLTAADLYRANLFKANLGKSKLIKANLTKANLAKADLSRTILSRADFSGADLSGASLAHAALYETIFGGTNFQDAVGLDNCLHHGPSTIDHRSITRSRNLSQRFLRGCGLPDELISHYRAYISNELQTHTCLISCSKADLMFSRELHDNLQQQGIRCWIIPEELKGGQDLQIQVSQALGSQDKLILVLSEQSMGSEWIMEEIQSTRELEKQEQRRLIYPVAVANPSLIQSWTLMEPGTFINLAKELRQHPIPNFHDMHHEPSYNAAFNTLLQSLSTPAHVNNIPHPS